MAVTVTHDFTTLYDANTSVGGATTYSGFQRFGSACNGGQVSQSTNHWTTTVASFSLVGRRIFTWMSGPAGTNTLANGGYRIVIGDGTNTRAYYVGGRDVSGFAASGWFCFTLDGDALPANFQQLAGSAQPNLAALTLVGIGFNVAQKATGNSPNVFWDVMRVGTGLTIAGGTAGDPGTLADIAALDELTTNAWGVLRRVDDGVFGCQGRLTFGATNAASIFREQDSLLFFEGVPSGPEFYRLTVQGSPSHNNEFTLGQKLGVIGVAGVTIQSARPWELIADTANSNVALYGCTVRGATNGVRLGGEVLSSTFDACGQTLPGTAEIRATTFSGYTGTAGALRWTAGIDIADSTFQGNTRAIEHPSAGTFTYNGLRFTGNTHDINNTSGSPVTIQASGGANPSTWTGATVTIENAVTLTLTGLVPNSEVRIFEADTTNELDGIEYVPGTTFQFTYNFGAYAAVDIVVHKVTYQYWRLEDYPLGSVDATLPVSQVFDRVYNNPA